MAWWSETTLHDQTNVPQIIASFCVQRTNNVEGDIIRCDKISSEASKCSGTMLNILYMYGKSHQNTSKLIFSLEISFATFERPSHIEDHSQWWSSEEHQLYNVQISEVRCMELTTPEFGNITDCDTLVGGFCNFVCNDGYMLEQGSAMRSCMLNGVWSGREPLCAREDKPR